MLHTQVRTHAQRTTEISHRMISIVFRAYELTCVEVYVINNAQKQSCFLLP